MIALDIDDSESPPTVTQAQPRRRPSEPLVAGERYQLGQRIARGGMGEVIAAHDAPIGREVAIKRMRAPNPTPLALARFLREARIQGRLDHPAIVPVHELGFDDEGRPFFAMKKLNGTTLWEVLSAPEPRFTQRQLLHALADVCLAIEFAHTRGVIHRDIKPANILLGDFGEVYVLDWGIARVPTDRVETVDTEEEASFDDASSSAMTMPGAAIGTPGYMSPEQAGGIEVDARADVYALGCLLYEILAGSPLHPRRKHEALRSTLYGVDARPSLRGHDIAPELDELCVRATALRRDDRIGSARELAERIQRYLEGDRDLALRSKLAHQHLAMARAAADDAEGRRVAMREAGQALALDPTLEAAAELIGRLMLEPPKQMPVAVRAELAQGDRATVERFVKNLIGMHLSSLAVLAVLWLLGLRDVLYTCLFVTLAISALTAAIIELRTKRDLMWVHNAGLFLAIVLMARCMSPLLLAPIMTAVNVVAFAFHPRGHDRRAFTIFVVLSSLALFGTWLCEAIGLVSPTILWGDGMLTLVSPLEGIEHTPAQAALAVYLAIGIVQSAVISFRTARIARDAREHSHLQAWQLRQLVPDRAE